MDARAFEDANAACSLPRARLAQLAIFCAYRVGAGGRSDRRLGLSCRRSSGAGALGALLSSAPPVGTGAGAGAGAAVAAVAVRAGGLIRPSYEHAMAGHGHRLRWLATWWPVSRRRSRPGRTWCRCWWPAAFSKFFVGPGPAGTRLRAGARALLTGAASTGGIGALAWTAFKVGALSFGGGFVIIPLMQGDAVDVYHWMTDAQFLNAVALGQVTPGPVVATVTAVGYAAHGVGGALLAAAVAFAPSFSFVLLGGGRFERLRGNDRARGFLDGAGPAAIGAILGSSVTLAGALSENWQIGVLAGAAVALLSRKREPRRSSRGRRRRRVALAGAPL